MSHWTSDLFVESPELLVDELRNRGESADAEVTGILDLVGDSYDVRPSSVLDAACGVGHHLVEFGDRGLRARGFDISERYVRMARDRIEDADVDAEAYVGDLRDVGSMDGRYDLVTCLWNSFGYFDEETNREVLEGFAARLSPGGVLVMDVAFRDAILADFDEDNVVDGDDRLVAEEWSYDPATGRYSVDRHLFDRSDGGLDHRGSSTWDVRAYSAPEVEWLCRDVGFEGVRTVGDYGGSPPNLDSGRLTVAAQK